MSVNPKPRDEKVPHNRVKSGMNCEEEGGVSILNMSCVEVCFVQSILGFVVKKLKAKLKWLPPHKLKPRSRICVVPHRRKFFRVPKGTKRHHIWPCISWDCGPLHPLFLHQSEKRICST